MPTSDVAGRTDRLYRIMKLFEEPGQRLRTLDIARRLNVSTASIKRDIRLLNDQRRLPLRKEGQYWMLAEDAHIQQLHVWLDQPEGVLLYLAGRMLTQIQDKRNSFVFTALTKIIDAMPKEVQPYQRTSLAIAEQRLYQQQEQRDISAIFEALALGWMKQRKVRILYAPPGNQPKFECVVCPYLLEPTGIGRTFYILGYGDPPGDIRTYRIERIEYAELLKDESFELPTDFNLQERLSRAWIIMYGDEGQQPIKVQLRFSSHVTGRLKENSWHPTQRIDETPEGCIWTALIGDTLEIENWIRSWGSDCEVLEPLFLRESVIDHVRRSARLYGIAFQQPLADDEPDTDLFRSLF